MSPPDSLSEWYYERAGAQSGPVIQTVLLQMFQAGEISEHTLVWRSGMTDWKALGAMLDLSGVKVNYQASAAPVRNCSECGMTFPASDMVELRGLTVCARCKPIALQKMMEGVAPAVGGSGAWRENIYLVFNNGASLPDACVKCGAPPVQRKVQTLYWHSPWLYVLALSPVIYIIVSLIVRKSVTVAVPLCETHRSKRSTGFALIWTGMAVIIGSAIATASFNNGAFMFGGLLGLVLLVIGGRFIKLLTPVRIENNVCRATGCCDETLAKLQRIGSY